jgi:hypothetical protein
MGGNQIINVSGTQQKTTLKTNSTLAFLYWSYAKRLPAPVQIYK